MSTIQHATARKLATKPQPKRHKQQPAPRIKHSSQDAGRRSTRSQTRSLPEVPFPIFVISVSVITVGMIINVAQQALVSQLSFEIDSVKKQIQVAQQAQDKLLAEKAILESPQRIESVATGKLSMVKAPKVSYLRIAEVETEARKSGQAVALAGKGTDRTTNTR